MIIDENEDEDEIDSTLPLRELHRILGSACSDCQASVSAHEVVWNIALGFANAVRCFPCLCSRLKRDPQELREQLIGYVKRRDCYLRAWKEAEILQGPCSMDLSPIRLQSEEQVLKSQDVTEIPADADWDAGNMGCGELVMELRIRMNKLAPGAVLHVIASDPAAPEDIPSWCRLCGHTLIASTHPHYHIRRREV